jgi:BirA family biotin operon repressor/biotin-[acetyl-CoA-carboxylase] ligase
MFKMKAVSPFGGAPIFFKPETESTQTDVKNLASQGLPSGTVVTAGHQFAGRGRFPDRKWVSAPGESLVFSVLFQTRDLPPLTGALPLRIGLAVASGLEKALGLKPQIKWPNDVLLNGRKTAGILVENREECVFIGVGVNCGPKSYPKELKKTATSLREAVHSKLTPEEILLPLLEELKTWIFGGENWKEEVENRLYAKGETVMFLPGLSDGTEAFEALLVGIQDDGRILLQPSGSTEPGAFANGELRYTPPKKGFFTKLKGS